LCKRRNKIEKTFDKKANYKDRNLRRHEDTELEVEMQMKMRLRAKGNLGDN